MTTSVRILALVLCFAASAAHAQEPITPADHAKQEKRIDELERALQELIEQKGSDDERIQALEAELEAVRDGSDISLEEMMGELETLRADFEDTGDSIWSELSRRNFLSGYAVTYLRFQGTDIPYFRLVKANLLLNGQVNERLRFFGEIEFENAAKVGEGAGVVKLEQGFFEFIFNSTIGLRMGGILVPFGYWNLLHEEWRFPFTRRPLVNDRVFPSTYTDIGAGLFGTLYNGETLNLTYDVAVVNGLTSKFVTNIGSKGLRSARPVYDADNNDAKSVVGRLGFEITEHVILGLSGYWGIYEDDTSDSHTHGDKAITMFGLDFLLTYPDVGIDFRSEFVGQSIGSDHGTMPVDDDGDDTTPEIDVPVPGWAIGAVAELELSFFPDALKDTFLGETFDNPLFFLAVRGEYISQFYDVALDAAGDDVLDEIAVHASIGFRPIYRSRFRVEFGKGWGDFVIKDDWRVFVSFALGY